MKKKYIAFIFSNMLYGSSSAHEGLDAVLSTCVFSDRVGIFFISDGVFLLLSNQHPNEKFGKNCMPAFEILSLCGIYNVYLCADSACERGLTKQMNWISKNVIWLSSEYWRQRLLSYDIAFRF